VTGDHVSGFVQNLFDPRQFWKPFPVPSSSGTDPLYYADAAWRKAASADYDTVVVSARWATVGLLGPPYCHQAGAEPCKPVLAGQKQALVLLELRAAIERTLRAGKTVLLFASAPESRWWVPKRLAREAFWHGGVRLTIDVQSLQAQTVWLDDMFAALKAEPGFHLLSLRDKLCDDTQCRVYDSTLQRPVFLDQSHFDPVWIAENAGLFAPFVRADR